MINNYHSLQQSLKQVPVNSAVHLTRVRWLLHLNQSFHTIKITE